MSLIRGENVVVYVFIGGQWKLIVCGRSCTLTTNADSIETSITGSGPWRTYEYGALTWTGTIDGIVMLQQANTEALPDIAALQYTRTKIIFRYQRTDASGNVYLNEGTAIIRNVTDTGEVNSMNTFSIELLGTGALTAIFTPTVVNPSGKVKILDYTGIAGETFFTNALLNLQQMINISVDGVVFSPIIFSGTPLNKEVKYTSSGGTGRLDFPVPLEAGTQVHVEYQEL